VFQKPAAVRAKPSASEGTWRELGATGTSNGSGESNPNALAVCSSVAGLRSLRASRANTVFALFPRAPASVVHARSRAGFSSRSDG
jgi:hypothetical protein